MIMNPTAALAPASAADAVVFAGGVVHDTAQDGAGHRLLAPGRADTTANRIGMSRVMGALIFLGGVLGIVSPLLPQPPGFSPLGVLVPSVSAIAGGLFLFIGARHIPPMITVSLAWFAPLLITVHSYYAGSLAPTVTMLYVWVSVLTFYYLARWIAWGNVAVLAITFAVLVYFDNSPAGAMRWLYTMTTVVVTGWLVSHLVSQVHRLAEAERAARREAERARAETEVVSRHKTEFLAGMSHELRTPLNAIIGFSEVLKARMFGELNDRQDEYVGDILGSGQHLLALINDILDIAKVEAGRMELDVARFSLRETIESAAAMLRERAGRKQITLAVEVDPRVDDVEADERKVKQVLFNLLTNAVKFTPEGGRITVGSRPGAGEVVVAVADSGIGIAREDQAVIFEEFRQVGDARTGKQEGTGLGLPLAKSLVELHGGRMEVESAVGVGSTFTFTLPMRSAPLAVQAPAAPSPQTQPALHTTSPVILLVEDDRRAEKLLTIFLEDAGYEAVVARDAQEGLVMARALRPAGIVLDIILPGIDGWEFLAQLKADPEVRDTPVIIVSMLNEPGRGFALGASEYLVKPVDRQALLTALRCAIPHWVAGNGKATVLAIDDDPLALDVVEAMLSPEGLAVLRATSGAEGVEIARRVVPDLVVLDLLMPGMDGFQVAEALHSDARTAHVPILVLTSASLTATEKERLNAHISYLAQKGQIDSAAFINLVRRSCPTET